jgi:dTDP-4-amino-4,6-dideoxygalactose transaminase
MNNWPFFSSDEINAVAQVLKSGKVNYWTGNEVRLFEQEFADYVGVSHAVAVSNGTVALELCLRSLGIGPGDEVIVTSRTFLASASAIIVCGAKPIFADVSLDSQNITVDTIDSVLSSKTKAIICVHLAGWPCDMPLIMDYANKNNLYAIEDCAQAHGASIDKKKVGSWGDVSAFSFCQDKIMTTGGEGGMVTTNNKELWKKAWSYKDHGKSYNSVYYKKHPPGFRWLHESIGTNWRMTEMQAAIGRIQLTKLDCWLSLRNRFAKIYRDFFSQYEIFCTTKEPANIYHAYYKFYVFIKSEFISVVNRDELMLSINDAGIKCQSGSCSEIYKEKCFVSHSNCFPKKSLKSTNILGKTSLMFEIHPTLTDDIILKNISKIQSILRLNPSVVELIKNTHNNSLY